MLQPLQLPVFRLPGEQMGLQEDEQGARRGLILQQAVPAWKEGPDQGHEEAVYTEVNLSVGAKLFRLLSDAKGAQHRDGAEALL